MNKRKKEIKFFFVTIAIGIVGVYLLIFLKDPVIMEFSKYLIVLLYIGYVNTSIREMKNKINELEKIQNQTDNKSTRGTETLSRN